MGLMPEKLLMNLIVQHNQYFIYKKIKENPYEITMCEYLENFLEARRRSYLDYGGNRLPEIANIWIYN